MKLSSYFRYGDGIMKHTSSKFTSGGRESKKRNRRKINEN